MVLLGGPLGISLAPYIVKNPGLHRFIKPWANMFINASGYRKVGLRYDDLISEEREDVQKALSRLPDKESYDRVYRMRRAFQCDTMRRLLPKDQWTKPEEDVRYLTPYIREVEKEDTERAEWDAMDVKAVRKPLTA
ncbi:probable ubiquinol--cytochrome-c reductase [Serendipita indica DSM 11827]|uniref:Cytochrome b-c1 complex subunit 7 n=1 Tax=Serendipita indica (strain DSM 11827) TaxID=1109443 RepID=G4TJV1_SERID|nr:probable ubiquinol--cytochrome-c reductase [Serendipita indica DSM 11827]